MPRSRSRQVLSNTLSKMAIGAAVGRGRLAVMAVSSVATIAAGLALVAAMVLFPD